MLARPHLSIARARRGRVMKPDLSLLEGVVAPRVLDAMRDASAALSRLGIRHVVVGGLAVGANGHPRATKDVVFLVGDEAFELHGGGFVTMKPGVPIQINRVPIDLLSSEPGEEHLAAALTAPAGSPIDAPRLVYMKLKAGRLRDRGDVADLVNAGIDVEACRAYLGAHAPQLAADFEAIVVKAADE
jgi:hypothetical protein